MSNKQTTIDPVVLANLLAALIPVGMQVYNDVQKANADKLKPLADILAAAEANWNAVASLAASELAK